MNVGNQGSYVRSELKLQVNDLFFFGGESEGGKWEFAWMLL